MILLRKVEKKDKKWLFELRNDKDAFKYFLNPNPVKWDEHKRWFERIYKKDTEYIYIACDDKNNKIGMIKFALDKNHAVVNINIDKKYRGKGYSSKIITMGTNNFVSINNKVRKINALIKSDNIRSIKSFTKSGYKMVKNMNGVLVFEYSISSETNSRKNILFTCGGGSGPIYLAKRLAKKYNIFLVDGSESSIAKYLGFPYKKISFGNDPNYISDLDNVVKKSDINWIVPGADEELEKVAEYTSNNQNIKAIIPNIDFIKVCLNKKELMKVLKDKFISDLSYYKNKSEIKYPAIVKPIYGRGSREVHVVNDISQLNGYFNLYNKKFNEVLVQKKVVGEEYTVSVIVNNLNEIVGIVPKKVIVKRGITRVAVSERKPIIDKVCREIVRKMNPCGPFNVQLILAGNKAKIFEINPRLSTTSVLTDKVFGNEVELYIKYYDVSGIKNNTKMKSNVYLYRYEENIFI